MKYLIRSIIVTLVTFVLVSISSYPILAKTVHFEDVRSDSYYYEAIMTLSSEGVINGFPDGTYKPEEKVTRAQTSIVLTKLFQLELKNESEPIFTDVPTNHPYYKEIAAVQRAGIMKGNINKTFNPNSYLTRAEMAQVLVEAFKLNKQKFSASPFKRLLLL